MSNPVISIPKGTNILHFLHELDGKESRTKDAWIFVRKDVVEELRHQTEEPYIHNRYSTTFSLFHEVEDRRVISITLTNTSSMESFPAQWSTVIEIHCSEEAPFSIAFRTPTLTPTEAIFLVMAE